MNPTWIQHETNMKPTWTQHETNMNPTWNQHETNMEPTWNQHETNMKPTYNQDETNMKPTWNQHEPNMKPPWTQHETNMKPTWNQRDLAGRLRRATNSLCESRTTESTGYEFVGLRIRQARTVRAPWRRIPGAPTGSRKVLSQGEEDCVPNLWSPFEPYIVNAVRELRKPSMFYTFANSAE